MSLDSIMLRGYHYTFTILQKNCSKNLLRPFIGVAVYQLEINFGSWFQVTPEIED